MRVVITKSPDRKKKFRATLENGRTVDFGARGFSDYTKHKTPSRMRSYVLRHGGRIPKRIIAERDPKKIQNLMLTVNMSDKENWKMSGVDTAGFGPGGIFGVFQPSMVLKNLCRKRSISTL